MRIEAHEIKQFIHDCRTPLMSVDSALAIIESHLNATKEQDQNVLEITHLAREQALKLDRMLNQQYDALENE